MNFGRETILAAVAGFALGLVAAWTIWNFPQIVSKKETLTKSFEEITSPPVKKIFNLALSQPEDELLLDTAETTVSGKTEKAALVIVSGPLTDEVVEASQDGTFSLKVDLEEGVNEIMVTAYPADGSEEMTESRTVTYTKAEL